MATKELKQQLVDVKSAGRVENGRIVGEYDFYNYLDAFEGKSTIFTIGNKAGGGITLLCNVRDGKLINISPSDPDPELANKTINGFEGKEVAWELKRP